MGSLRTESARQPPTRPGAAMRATAARVAALSAASLLLPAAARAEAAPGAAPRATQADVVWVLVSAALVFFMQAGFKCLEVGFTQKKSATSVAMKNVVDWVVATIFYFLVGFGLMFGTTAGGWIGTDLFGLRGLDPAAAGGFGAVFFLFQLAFAGTSTTIISGALSERSSFAAYLVGSVLVSAVVYPIFGHWVWAGSFDATNVPWLAALGFVDFAGSTVVHSVGGWVALVGIWKLGPRRARFGPDGAIRPVRAHSSAYAALGVFILWFGWWGFNGGSTLALNGTTALVLVNTNLAAAMGGLVAFAHAQLTARTALPEKFLGGILGGLVAVTAGAHAYTPLGALAVGGLAGIAHNVAYDRLLRARLDDPVGAVPVHLACGVLGTLCVPLFGRPEVLGRPVLAQLAVQALGVLACFVWAAGSALLMYELLRRTVGLRVSAAEEEIGVTLTPDFVSGVASRPGAPSGGSGAG